MTIVTFKAMIIVRSFVSHPSATDRQESVNESDWKLTPQRHRRKQNVVRNNQHGDKKESPNQ